MAVVPQPMPSALSVMLLDEVVTLVAALKPSVVVPKLIPRCALSLLPTRVMGPDLAKMLPPNVVATSVVAVPDVPVMLMPPPKPVASMVPPKLTPKLAAPEVMLEASPTSEIACAVVLADRRVKPEP